MDYIKEILNVGDDVLSAVTSAVEKNDYSNLSSELKARFRIFEEDVRDDIRTRTGQNTGGQNRGLGGGYGPGPGMGQGNYSAGPNAWNGNFRPDSGMGQGNFNAGPNAWNGGNGPSPGMGQGNYSAGPGAGTTGYGYGPEGSQASWQAAPGHTRETPKSGQYRSYARPSNSRNSRRSKNAWDSYTRRSKNTRNSFAWSPGNLQNLYNPGQQKELTPFRPRFFSKGVPIAKLVTGIIGMVGFLPLSIGSFIMMLMGQSAGLITFFSMLPLTAASIWLTVSGNRKRKLINLYNRYAEIIGPAEYIAIGDLADRDGNSGERVQENIHKLMKADMLPQGRLDRNETTLMMTSQAWEQYQAAERSRQEREAEVQERAVPETEAADPKSPVIREGNEFIQRVRHYNDRIPDPQMSEKLSRLESIMQRIFLQVEKDPDSAPDLHKLMNYYLPTTEKLIQAYIELDQHPAGSENIDRTRREIEDAVDTVNVAFEKLFDDLFQDTAWDISSDISVMKNMMKQDGLMEDPLKAGQEQ